MNIHRVKNYYIKRSNIHVHVNHCIHFYFLFGVRRSMKHHGDLYLHGLYMCYNTNNPHTDMLIYKDLTISEVGTHCIPIYLICCGIPGEDNQQISKCTVSYPPLLALKDPTTFHLISFNAKQECITEHWYR